MEFDQITSMPSAKVVFLGNSSTGKTSLTNRYIHNTFDHYTDSTIGASFASKIVELPEGSYNAKIKFHIWDTAGQEKFHSLAPMYYRGALAAIFVFDICTHSTFDCLPSWMEKLDETGPKGIIHVIVGNKSDLKDKRQVSREEAERFSSSNGALYIEASARDNVNVDLIFQEIAKILDKEKFQTSTGTSADVMILEENRASLKSKCC